MAIANMLKEVGPLIKRNSSTILSGLAVAGTISTGVFAFRAGIKTAQYVAIKALQDEEYEFSAKELVKDQWPVYLPVVISGVATIGCVVAAQSINLRRQAAVISAFTISETALREYQERMAVEVPAKDRKVRDEMAKDQLKEHPASKAEILLAGNGDQLFYEPHTDRYFYSTMNKVDKAVNDLNFRVLNQEYASLNEFYERIGLKSTSSGDEFGWTADHPLELDKSTQLTDDDRAAVVITYVRPPIANYWKQFR